MSNFSSKKINLLLIGVLFMAAVMAGCGKKAHRNLIPVRIPYGWYTSAILADSSSGAGAAVFSVSCVEEFVEFAQIVNGTWGGKPARDSFSGKTVTLAAGIDLSAYDNWVPIGNYAGGDDNVFAGTFDGNDKLISNLTIKRTGGSFQGLFGLVIGGRIENVRLDGVNIYGRDYVGGVAGVVESGSVANSYSSGSVGGRDYIGGVAGRVLAGGSVIGSYSIGTVKGRDHIGGVAATLSDGGKITGSYSTGAISGAGRNIGGVAGTVENSSVTNSYSTGTVSGSSASLFVGGVVGRLRNSSNVATSYSSGTISGADRNIGGIAGAVEDNSGVANSYSAGAVNGVESVGGIAGTVEGDSRVENSYSGAEVSGTESVGGVAGYVSSSSVTGCYFAGAVSGEENVGGVAGSIQGGALTGSAALGSAVKGTGKNTGRVAGFILGNTVNFSNNGAYAQITNNAGTTEWKNKGEKTMDGADISAAEINTDGTIGGRFTDENGWTVEAGKYPSLRP